MKFNFLRPLIIAGVFAGLLGCSSNPNKAEDIDTELEKTQKVSGDSRVGVKDGEMVYQRKTQLSEELRDLQIETYSLEDKVYGNRKYGSTGLHGVLKKCRMELADKANGGDGKLKYMEPIDRVTDKEEELKLGLDEKDQLVAVNEEYLTERIARFRKHKMILQKREDEFNEKIDICKAEKKARKFEMEKQKSDDN